MLWPGSGALAASVPHDLVVRAPQRASQSCAGGMRRKGAGASAVWLTLQRTDAGEAPRFPSRSCASPNRAGSQCARRFSLPIRIDLEAPGDHEALSPHPQTRYRPSSG